MARSFVAASSQYLQHAAAAATAFPWTMACWFNSNSATANQTLMSISSVSGGSRLTLLALGGTGGDPLAAGDASGQGNTSAGYTINTWMHATGVYTATEARAYINGGNNSSYSNPTFVELNRTNIGMRINSSTPGVFMSGLIAEAAVWDVELTVGEIAILSKGYSPLFVRPANLVAYWPLIGRTSPEIDPVGKFDMTVTGATQAAHPRIIYPTARQVVTFAQAPPTGGTILPLMHYYMAG